ncbi:MAG TPA: DEAD/DEAH box helicase, partial [Phycisphaerales bacterium]|nr:DEAD/DEAH box helicase [Phycisphaerales bacterium]
MSTERIEAWFRRRGWSPFEFQRETWKAYETGWSGLVHAPTGTGKTMALFMGPVAEYLREHREFDEVKCDERRRVRRRMLKGGERTPGLRLLWVTPMRALANDTTETIIEAVQELGLPWSVELRTGDSSASVKARQRTRLPTVLVTTPESLSLMLSYGDTAELMRGVKCIVMDEWHELMGSKRGVQAQLAAAHIARMNEGLRIWGVSATIGNLEDAMRVLLGEIVDTDKRTIIHGRMNKEVIVDSLLPSEVERFPWAGHLGTRMLEPVLRAIEQAKTTLVFTNTRSQAEIWFAQIMKARTEWLGEVALHHGSLDRKLRERIEGLLRSGKLRCVVCTSSLDLGVDFSPVEQVIQIGSPRGVARLLQRAGRSGHQPGAVSRVLCVPTNAMELIDISAARLAANARRIERRPAIRKPMDVLVQHLVTIAAGEGFDEETLRAEVRKTDAFAELTEAEWAWAMGFVSGGGPALKTYPEYQRIARMDGAWRGATGEIVRMHRGNIGTIVSDGSVTVQFANGRKIGTVEESFIARVPQGGVFVFGGKMLELVRVV